MNKKRFISLLIPLINTLVLVAQGNTTLIPENASATDFVVYKAWDFENAELGRYTESEVEADFNPYYQVYVAPLDITNDVINGQSTKVLRITNWGNDLWHGFGMIIPTGNTYDELYFTYNWKFGENFNSTHGGKLSGFEGWPRDPLSGPDCPREGYGYICKVNFAEANKIYTYHYDRTEHGYKECPWGTTEYKYEDLYMANGTWYNITMRIVMNSFTNGNPNADGIFEVWVDGRMIFQELNLVHLDFESPVIKANGIVLSNYYGGSGFQYTPQTDCFGYIDNMSIYLPTTPLVTGRNGHDPNIVLQTPNEITDKRFYTDELITQSGDLHNSEWGSYYSSCIDETFLIDAGEDNTVTYKLESYQIGGGDFLFIYDGNTSDSKLMKIVQGSGGGTIFESTGRYMFIRLSVNTDGGALGFFGKVTIPDGVTVPPDTEPPTIPTGLLAQTVNVTSMNISWNPSSDNKSVTGYSVYVDGVRKDVTTTTTYNLTQLTANTTYNITVSAFDAASNESGQSAALTQSTLENDLIAPSVPGVPQAQSVTGNLIQIAWAPSEDNVIVSGYNIYLDNQLVGSIATNSFTLTGLSPNTSYSITVSAFDEVKNESAQSAPLSVTTGAPDDEPPTVPTGLTAFGVTDQFISLVWDPSTDNVMVQGYNVFSNGIQRGPAFSNSFTLTQLNPGISYDITVSAFDGFGNESEKSAKLTVKTINPDNTLEPTMPVIGTRKTTMGTEAVTIESRLDSLGHTEVKDYGVVFSRNRATLEFQPATFGDQEKDTVVHKGRVEEGLLVFYDFSEQGGNKVMDLSGSDNPLDLTINLPRDVFWEPGQGLKVTGSQTMIYSDEIPTSLMDRISSSNEITLEAWIKPSKLNQFGPARIITLSYGNDSRAFMLGHEGNVSDFEYSVRLKTENTDGLNGLPEVQTSHDFFSLGLHHVIYTRDKQGKEEIWVNNQLKYSGVRTGDLTWLNNNRFALANEWTLQRPWNGTFYLVAVYNRALDKNEIEDNYKAGFGELRYTVKLDTLQSNTAYYVSPFVRTDQGVVYGDVKQITLKNVLHFQGSDSLEFALVPNPSDGSFMLSFEDGSNEEPIATLRIADVSGHILFADTIILGENLKSHRKSYNLNGVLKSGIYSVILILGSNSKAQRLVVYPR